MPKRTQRLQKTPTADKYILQIKIHKNQVFWYMTNWEKLKLYKFETEQEGNIWEGLKEVKGRGNYEL